MRVCVLTAALMLLSGTPVRALDEGLPPLPSEVDRSSPLSTVQGFLGAAHKGNYPLAAYYLNLEGIAVSERATQGVRLARRLRFVLDRQGWLEVAAVSREPEGDPGHPGSEQLGVVTLDKSQIPIRVSRLRQGETYTWVFSRDTVRAVDRLYEVYGPPLGESLPEVFFNRPLRGLEVWQWIGLAAVLVLSLLASYVIERVLVAVGTRVVRMTSVSWDDKLMLGARGPLRLLGAAGLLLAGTTWLLLPPNVQSAFDILCRSLVIIGVAWLTLRTIHFASGVLQTTVAARKQSLANERSVRTQMAVMQRVLTVLVYIVGGALLLMQFSVVRSVGVSILASAGVAGIVVGLAAQKSIGTLLAGIQLSITQPIRIGDSVVVEGDSGTVEEIKLTYVVIRVWDLRRLVIPITYFLDKPFQNWSKGPPDMLGVVNLQVDYTADLESFRAELKRILSDEGKALWDGKKASLAVTEALERTQTLRILVSAADSNQCWDLRCLVRERLVQFLRLHPTWLPTQRTQPTPVPLAESALKPITDQ